LSNLAILALRQGNLAEAQTYGEASLEARRSIGDKRGITNSLSILATITYDQNQDAAAQRYFEEILEMQRAINDRWGMATTLANLGEIAGFAGRFPEAHAYLQEGLALYRQLDQPLGLSNTLVGQGDVAYEQGDSGAARALFEEALDIKRKINDQSGVALCLTALAYLDAESGALAAAEHQLLDALALLRELDLGELPRALATLAATRRTMGQSGESIYPLLREALTLKQARTSLRRMSLVLIEVSRVLLLDERYATLGELIGLLLRHNISYRSRQTVTQLLDEVRPHLDAAALDAALQRGGSSDVDAVVADVLAALE
jgi:tetratricopeptide (TPR) repeat protein